MYAFDYEETNGIEFDQFGEDIFADNEIPEPLDQWAVEDFEQYAILIRHTSH